MVGRAAELTRLRRALTEAGGGRRGAVAVLGEAGIGKTRLVDEMAHEASHQGFRLIAGRAQGRVNLWTILQTVIGRLDS